MVGTEPAPKQYISPSDIAHSLQVHPSAPVRWMTRGSLLTGGSRVFLKSIRLPGGFRTTQEWLDEFLRVVADDKVPTPDESPKPATKPTPKSERVARMNAGLAAAGF
jgi:hypothetical protein